MKVQKIIAIIVTILYMLSTAVSIPQTVKAAPNNPVEAIQLSTLPGKAYVEPITSAYTLGDGPETLHKNWYQASYTGTDRLYSMSTGTSNTVGDGFAIKIQKDNNLAELTIDASGCTNIVAKYWLKDATNPNDISEVMEFSNNGGISYQPLPDRSYPSAITRVHRLEGADNNPNVKIKINGSLPVRRSHVVWLDNIAVFSDTTAPTWNNSSLTASNITNTGMRLSWNGAADNINSLESGVRDYRIYKGSELLATVTNDVYYEVIGLAPNQSYLFSVQAGDVAGNWSTDGPAATFSTAAIADTTPPQWISRDLILSNLGQKSLTLSWSGAQDETAIEGYRIYRDAVLLDTVSSNVYSYDVNDLVPGTSYTFRLEAGDIVGNWTNNGPMRQVVSLSSGTPMLKENFEGGTLPAGWELSTSGGNIQLVNDPLNIQGKCLELADTSASTSVSAKYGLGQKNGVISVEYRFMHKERVGTMYLPIYGRIAENGTDREFFRLSTGTGNMLTYGNDANGYTNIGTIETDRWYTAKVIVDINNRVSYFSINGEDGTHYVSGNNKLYGITSSPYTPVTINKIGFYTKSTDTALLYIDDIKVYDTDLSVGIPVWPSDKSLTASEVGKKTITLQWSEAADYLGIKNYIVFKNNEPIAVVPENTRSYVIGGLDPGTSYDFKVEAEDAAGNRSTDGPVLQKSTLPKDETEPPKWMDGSLTAPVEDIDANALKLVWTPASDNTGVTAYRIYQDGVLIATLSGDVLSHVVTGLTQNTLYVFKVCAGDASDNWSEGLEAKVSTIGDMKPPVWISPYFGMEGTSSTSGLLSISWRGATDNVGVTQYRIYEGDTLLETVEQLLLTLNGLTPGEKHTFTVMAGDAAGNWSTDNPKATFQSHDPILPTWQSSVLTGTNVNASSLVLQWSGAIDNGKIAKYRIYREGVLENTVAGNVSSYTVTGLLHDTRYEFKVQAVDAMNNESTDGPVITLSTAHSDDTVAPFWSTEAVEAAEITTNSLTLHWSGANDSMGVTGYRIYNGNRLIETLHGDATAYEVRDLAPGMRYTFTVQACDAAGNWSVHGPLAEVTTLPVFGTTRYVASLDELNAAVAGANPGDIIILKDGAYEAGVIAPTVDKHGLPNARIIIRAENAGMAEIKAVTGFSFTNCSYITVEGIKFTGKQTKAASQAAINMFGCNNMRITRCHIMLDESQAQNESGYSLAWVTIKSQNNVVSHHNHIDRNIFEKKLAPGVMLSLDGDWEAKQVSQYDIIEYNHFKDSKPRVDNGKEAIRYGTSYNSQSSAFGIVQYNLFEECDGDPEFLSIKSSDVTIRYNTFLNSMGQFTFRHGDRNTAYGNFFLGDGVKAGVGGMRIYGTDHKIFGNYFQGLTAQTLQIDGGDSYDNGKLTDKWTIRRTEISFNTIINCAFGITIWGGREYAPQDITIANNLVMNSGGISYTTSKSAVVGIPTPRPAYAGNIVFPTLYPAGKTKAEENDPLTEQEVRLLDPKMQLSGMIFRPASSSPVIDAAVGSYPQVAEDMDGQRRVGLKDVGADEVTHSPVTNRPLSASEVGINASGDAPGWSNGKVMASEVNTSSLRLTWEGAGDNRAVTQYRIFCENRQIASVTGDVYSSVISGLQPDTQYTFVVQAMDEDGNMSIEGPSVTIRTLQTTVQNGDDEDIGSSPVVVTPKPEEDIPVVRVKAVLTGQGQTEAKAVIEKGILEKAFEKSAPDTKGNRVVSVEVSDTPGANAYTVILPVEMFTSEGAAKKVEIKTALASVTIPENMMHNRNITNVKEVDIRIAGGNMSGLPAEIAAKVENHPVIDLSISTDGSRMEFNSEEAPVRVSIPYKPIAKEQEGPEFITVWHIDSLGRQTPVFSGKYDAETETVTFTVPTFGRYAVVYVKKSFEDLSGFEWAQKQVEVLASKGIVKGKTDISYDPGANVTRADFTLMLVKSLGLKAKIKGNFEDIQQDDYYYEAVGIAKSLGIVNGEGDERFNPKKEITRQDMMTIAARAMRYAGKLGEEGNQPDLNRFTDSGAVSDYAVQSVASLVKAELIQGSNNEISPLSYTTRAELAVLMYRIYNR